MLSPSFLVLQAKDWAGPGIKLYVPVYSDVTNVPVMFVMSPLNHFTACSFQVVRKDIALRGRYGEAHAGSCVSYLLFDLLCSCQ